jgi:hypothetical protein
MARKDAIHIVQCLKSVTVSYMLVMSVFFVGATFLVPGAEATPSTGHITIHRVPEGNAAPGVRLLLSPGDFVCRDDGSPGGATIVNGVNTPALTGYGPNNKVYSVTCTPSFQYNGLPRQCTSAVVWGYWVDLGSANFGGSHVVTSKCAGGVLNPVDATQTIAYPTSATPVTDTGTDLTPWTCRIDDNGLLGDVKKYDWWTHCELTHDTAPSTGPRVPVMGELGVFLLGGVVLLLGVVWVRQRKSK